MKRLVLLGLLLGFVNAVAAVSALYAVYRTASDEAFGWFAYAPLQENVVYDYYYGFPWEYVVVPAVLVVLNAVLLPFAAARGWLTSLAAAPPHEEPPAT